MRIVLDTSAAANIILRTPQSLALIDVMSKAQHVVAPTLFHSEISNVLWKQVQFAATATATATATSPEVLNTGTALNHDTALNLYQQAITLIDQFIPDADLAVQATSLTIKQHHPAYDMYFVATAQRYAASILTLDKKLISLCQSLSPSLVVGQMTE
jgi:predicted nucleic acid-binding protein